LLAARRWLRFYKRFWTQQLDTLSAVLETEDGVAPANSDSKGGQ
jgi:hypothetical protein